jgi:starch-binding outer membrane protein, SusD/RagB family
MNRKYFIPIAFFSWLILAGCEKLNEDPKASLTPQTYFQSQSDLDAALAGVYSVLSYDGSYGFTSRMTSYFGAEDLTTDPGLNKADFRDFDRLSGSSSNGSMLAGYQGPWRCIYQANNLLANYQKVKTTDDLKNQAAGQAYFLRAWSYYMLVRTFGPTPIVTGSLSAEQRVPRADVATVYDTIVNDLTKAIGLLPATFAGQPGKVTQNSAKSLLADVYLTMSGWPLKQADKAALAASTANEVITSGQYSLVPHYADVFKQNNTTESIFTLQFNVSGGLPQRSYGSSSVPLDETALNGDGGWDDYYPEINYYLNAPKCERSTATFYDTIKLLQPDKTTYNLVPWNSPLTHAGHPYYRKFRAGLGSDGVAETANTILSIHPSTNKALDLIRYPMVLLDFAEATAMTAGPNGDAYTAINLVRVRAGEQPLPPGLSASDFQDSVVKERAYEFAGETGIRWFDICRLQILPQVIASRSPLENPVNPAVAVQDAYLSPIPYQEMLLNPSWTQNPGY